jgi:hypothetical protein
MKKYFLNVILLLAFFISSCQKEVPVEIPNAKSKIVLNCIMNEDSLFTVLVSRTKKLYVDDNVDMALTNASVSVYENGVLIENLSHDSIGIYSSKTFKPKVGNKYKVLVKADGYVDAVAEEVLIQQAKITDLNVKDSSYVKNGAVYSKLSFFIDDPANTSNYYELQMQGIGMMYIEGIDSTGQPIPMDSTRIEYPISMLVVDESLKENYTSNSITGNDDYMPQVLQFSDKFINGSKYKIEVYFSSDNFFRTDSIIINIKSVSKSFYEYKRTVLEQNNTGPFSEPVRVYSNVTGGVGILGSYNITKKYFTR